MSFHQIRVFLQGLLGILDCQGPPLLVKVTESPVGVVVWDGRVLHEGLGVALDGGLVVPGREQLVSLFLQFFIRIMFSGHSD